MVSSRIRGIKVEIDGDTQKLGDALKGVSSESGSLQHELKEVNRLLKLDPGNTELLQQQQALLNDQLDASREKLEKLRQVEEQMQEKFRIGEIGAEEMRSFQRELVRTEQEIRRTEEQLNGLDEGLDDAGDSAGEFTEKFQMGLKAASAAVAAAGVAIAGKGIASMDDMQKALNQVQSATGATADEMGEFREIMGSVYKGNFGEDFNDIAEAMSKINQQTGITGEALQSATENALMMRDTFGWDVNESIRAVDMMMRQFGISSDEAYTLLAQGAQQGLDKNDNLLDSLNEYSAHFAQMGYSAEETFNMMAAGAEVGVFDIDKLGDALKEFGIRSKDASDGTKQAFADLGINDLTEEFAAGGESAKEAMQTIGYELEGMQDKVLQNQVGVALFGTMWEDMGADAVIAMITAQDQFDKTADTLEQINNIKYDTFGEAVTGIGRQIQVDLLIPIGQALLPALNAFADVLKIAAEHLNVIGPIMAGLATGIVAFTVATQGAAVATKAAAIAQELLNFALKDNPIGLAVSAIMAAVTAITILWTTNEDFRNVVIQIWQQVTTVISGAIENVKTFLNSLGKKFTETWESIKQSAEDFKTGLLGKFSALTSAIVAAVQNFASSVKQKFGVAFDGVTAVFDAFKSLFSGNFKGFLEQILQVAGSWVKGFTDIGGQIISGLVEGIKSKLGDAISAAKSIGISLLDTVKNVLDIHSPSKATMKIGEQSVEGFIAGIENMESELTKSATDQMETLKALYSNKIAEIDEKIAKSSGEKQIAKLEKQKAKYGEVLNALTEEQQGFAESMRQATTEFSANVSQAMQEIDALNQAYIDAVNNRAQQIIDFAGLFDKVKFDEDVFNATEMIENLKEQVSIIEQWRNNLATLEMRGIDSDLLAELQELGVGSNQELEVMVNMTDEQLQEFSELFRTKNALARQQAEKEMEGLRADTDKKIKVLNQQTAANLETYTQTWIIKTNNLVNQTNAKIGQLTGDFTKTGVNAMLGLQNGMLSKEPELLSEANRIASAIADTINAAFDIHSPSRVMRKTGENIMRGLTLGITENAAQAVKAMSGFSADLNAAMATPERKQNGAASYDQRKEIKVDQTLNFYDKVESPLETARQLRKVNRKLAEGL